MADRDASREPATHIGSRAIACEFVAAADFDVWSKHTWTQGLQIDGLTGVETVSVSTRNSKYEIRVLSARTGEVLLRGGQLFKDYTAVQLAGSSLGGTFLKRHGIYVGFSMELKHEEKTIVTTEVQSIEVQMDGQDEV